MRKILIFITLTFTATFLWAQFVSDNFIMRTTLIEFQKNASGHMVETNHHDSTFIGDLKGISYYGFDKKKNRLFGQTMTGNYIFYPTKETAKLIKKDKEIPQLDPKEADIIAARHTNEIISNAHNFNISRDNFLADSIHKVRLDSIEKARMDSLAEIKRLSDLEEYRKTHNWRELPIRSRLTCSSCKETVKANPLPIFITRADTLVSPSVKETKIGVNLVHYHLIPFHPDKYEKDYLYHIEAFKDSLALYNDTTPLPLSSLDDLSMAYYIDALKKAAPYGFFDDWGWDNEYGMVTFHFTYTNLNDKTIKYIRIYFKITNAVDDVRLTGYFQGTGPLDTYSTASWNWDSSSYFVSGDASQMKLTKVVITYMNGSTKTLTGNNIIYDD
ncbi:MAG: hypothetical protein NC194_04945 [Prevotella sp.]|nr:hypothetical protein [Prevotella sp.]